MGYMQEHQFNTDLVILYPVDRNGNLIPKGEKTKRYVKCDGTRYEVPPEGIVIEHWKAQHIIESQANLYTVSADDLRDNGVHPMEDKWRKQIGALTTRPKYQMRMADKNELVAAIGPVDEERINAYIQNNEAYYLAYQEFGPAIRTIARTNPEILEQTFEAFSNVLSKQ